MSAELRDYLLAFADDEHLMGQQHTEWIGVTPFLEEDLAFASIGQDELGHAALLYELVCELDGVEPTDAAIDTLAYGRAGADYRSSAYCEYSTSDWSEALVQHWIYDVVEEMRWDLVAKSTHLPLAELVPRATREEIYHRRHADALLDSLLAAPESQARLLSALEVISPLIPSLLATTLDEPSVVASGLAAGPTKDLLPDVVDAISRRFAATPTLGNPPTHGRTERSASFAPLMKRMREVFDLDPAATW